MSAPIDKARDLRERLTIAAAVARHPDCSIDDVVAELLPAALVALELAGLTRDEPERCALYDCLSDYLAPAAPKPHLRLVEVERLAGGGIVA